VPSESKLALYGNQMPLSPFELDDEEVQLFFNPLSPKNDQVNTINDDCSHFSLLEPK